MKTLLVLLMFVAMGLRGQTINEYQSFIKTNEGCKLSAYRDSRGYLTIGYGFKMPSNYPHKITQKTADALLARETVKALSGAKRIAPTFDSQPEAIKLVLVDLVYNMGASGVLKFEKMLAACQNRDYRKMAKELKNSLYYRQVTNRAEKNRLTILSESSTP